MPPALNRIKTKTTPQDNFVESIDGWKSPTDAIEILNNSAGIGDASDGEQFIELNNDPSGHFPDSPGIFKNLENRRKERTTPMSSVMPTPSFQRQGQPLHGADRWR